jgi:hypothetical protein
LTPRELDVLRLVAQGLTKPGIARQPERDDTAMPHITGSVWTRAGSRADSHR